MWFVFTIPHYCVMVRHLLPWYNNSKECVSRNTWLKLRIWLTHIIHHIGNKAQNINYLVLNFGTDKFFHVTQEYHFKDRQIRYKDFALNALHFDIRLAFIPGYSPLLHWHNSAQKNPSPQTPKYYPYINYRYYLLQNFNCTIWTPPKILRKYL